MDTIESLQNQLKNTESKFSGYGADLPGEIESQIQKAYSPLLKESLGVTKGLMGDYLGRYFDTTQMGPGMAGTTAMDLSPTQKLGVMGRELGTMAGDLQATTRYSDYLGGQMNDLYSKAVSAAQLGRQDISDEYNRVLQQLQMAQQLAEAEKDRALQRELAARSGGGGGTIIYGGGGDNVTTGGGEDDGPDITVEDGNWTKYYNQPLSKTPVGQIMGIQTPGWVKSSPFATGVAGLGTLTGNLLGNLMVPKRENMTFIDKLFNR